MAYSSIFHIHVSIFILYVFTRTHAFLTQELKLPFSHSSGRRAKVSALWKWLAQQEKRLHCRKIPAGRQQSNNKQDVKHQMDSELLRAKTDAKAVGGSVERCICLASLGTY